MVSSRELRIWWDRGGECLAEWAFEGNPKDSWEIVEKYGVQFYTSGCRVGEPERRSVTKASVW
ncbi:MAG: hypothetical protein HFE94_01740 [Acutalibacter sp.]|nr:hypothetical protein [Acutalibacter sp.]